MNEEQKYLFGVNGFIVIENVRQLFYSCTHALPSLPPTSSSRTLRTAGSLQITNDGGAMMTDLLGFAPTQLGAPTEATETIVAANAARIDKNRAVVFHCPSLGGGSYSTAGRMGGSALHMVPITVPLGVVQSWEVSVPIKVDCGIAGSTLAELRCYLATEDGDPVELLGDRWEAVVVLEY